MPEELCRWEFTSLCCATPPWEQAWEAITTGPMKMQAKHKPGAERGGAVGAGALP